MRWIMIYHAAEEYFQALNGDISQERMDELKERLYQMMMLELAKATGFFSVWMDVFQGDGVVRQGLIGAFMGT